MQNIIIFSGGEHGPWKIRSIQPIVGETIPMANRLTISKGDSAKPDSPVWTLQAFISNLRYTNRDEKTELDNNSRGLAQPEYNCSALIPIRKSDEWWRLTQDERRKIFEEDSHHIRTSVKYLSMISRQLHHSRDLGEQFDFLTWFEFSSAHESQFNELVKTLRRTEEWKYVTREVDIRLDRA